MKIRILFISVLVHLAVGLQAADRPNFVWIVSEDNSVHYLNHFFPGGAKAPAIEALATKGLTFDHAFCNAPVCSVARTTLATSCYGPRIGTQFHRRYTMVPLPQDVKMFPAYLREAGYYTTNNSKTDYNAKPTPDTWDESSKKASWRNRQPDQPFFHMESHGASHESSLHFGQSTYENHKTTHDPSQVKLANCFPDTPLFRYTHAYYLDRMKTIDGIVASTVAKLKADGLLEDTFIFYFGDHGGVLPRGKGYIYNTGLQVPLVIRVPEKFTHLVKVKRGSRLKGFVEFVDFGPTVLQLAGVPVPKGVDGKPFLGPGVDRNEVNTRNESFGYADRFDEKYDLLRSLRMGRFQYIRSFQPYLPDGLMNIYRYKMLAYKEWRKLWDAGKLSGGPAQFFQSKQAEMLFDLEADPFQINNLAKDPAHAETLKKLRKRLTERMKSMPDLSLYPESRLVREGLAENPVAYGQTHKAAMGKLLDLANAALRSWGESEPQVEAALKSDDAMQRMWACMVCSSFGAEAKSMRPHISDLLQDPDDIVKIRAAEFLGIIGEKNPQPLLARIVNTTEDSVLATEALNSVIYFKDFYGDKYPVKRSDFDPGAKGADVMDRLNYINGIPYPPRAPKKKKKKKAA